jgi:hypothetical protein
MWLRTCTIGSAGPSNDRLRTGAYITDGTELYEVRGLRLTGANFVKVTVEDCRTFATKVLTTPELRRQFRLVRSAPHGAAATGDAP